MQGAVHLARMEVIMFNIPTVDLVATGKNIEKPERAERKWWIIEPLTFSVCKCFRIVT